MALSSKVGSFVANTSTGNQVITGVGFKPSAIIFFVTDLTSDGSSANLRRGVGFATSSSARGTIAGDSDDANAPHTATARRHDDTKCITLVNASFTVLFDADLVTMDSDGFTLNITTTDASARIVGYIAFGGTDLTNATVKRYTSATSTGNQAFTGVGFQPDSIILMTNISSSAPPASQTATFFNLGFGKSSTKRSSTFNVDQAAGDSKSIQRTDKILETENGGSIFFSADLVTLDSDGFTLNWTTVNGTPRYIYALCLKGGLYDIGSFNQATTTGNQSITGVGFQPTGLILASGNFATSTAITAPAKLSLGWGTSSSSRECFFTGGVNADPSVTSSNLDRTKIIKMMTANSATPTTDAAADLVTLGSDGFTLNWTTADATAREILYMAVGSTAASTRYSIFSDEGLVS